MALQCGGVSIAGPILIYSPPQVRQRLGLGGRAIALIVALACLAPLVVAATLKPNPAGVGTHEGLHLNSCYFLDTTHLPCPSCGMTTSFSWFVRGNWLASFYVQPMGFVLALAAACTFWGALFIAITAKPAHRLLRMLPGATMIIAAMSFGIAAWGWKIFIHLRGIDGWH
jgi:hypothetical protein